MRSLSLKPKLCRYQPNFLVSSHSSSNMLRWMSRCLPGFSTVLLLLLLGFAFADLDNWIIWGGSHVDLWEPAFDVWQQETHDGKLKLSQKLFIVYYIATHVDTAGFAVRLCLALILVKRKIKQTLRRRQVQVPDTYQDGSSPLLKQRRGPSPPPPYTSTPPSPNLPGLPAPGCEVVHAIIVPNYCESLETLNTTLKVLASHPRARTQYEVGGTCPPFSSQILTTNRST